MRLRFRYSLQALMICSLLLALGFAWLGINMRKARRQAAAMATLQKSWNFACRYDFAYDGPDTSKTYALPTPANPPSPPEPKWLSEWLGVDFFHDVVEISLTLPGSLRDPDPDRDRYDPFHDSRSKFQFDHWEVLGACPNLRDLTLRNNYAGTFGNGSAELSNADRFFQQLAQLQQLERLELDSMRLNQEHLAALRNHPNLKVLDLQSCALEADTLSRMGTLPKLEVLRVSYSFISSESEPLSLPVSPRLRILDISRLSSNEETLRSIGPGQHLEILYLKEVPDISSLQKLPRLSRLSLEYCEEMDDEGLANVVRALPNLEALDLGNTQASEKTLLALSEHARLKAVNLNGTSAEEEKLIARFCRQRPDLTVHCEHRGYRSFDWLETFDPQDEVVNFFSPSNPQHTGEGFF